MTTRRFENERINKEVPPQVEKVPQFRKHVQGAQAPPQGDLVPNVEGGNGVPVVHLDLTNQEIREAFVALAQAVTNQINLSMVPRVVKSSMTFRLRDFVTMNPTIILGSKVGEDPQEFLMGCIRC